MKKKPFLPASYKHFVIWLQNFARKLLDHAATLDVDSATTDQITNDAYLCSYAIQLIEIFKQELSERVKFRKLLYDGSETLNLDYPVMPVIPTLPGPPVPKAGVVKRVAKVAKVIKLHPNYTEAIGEDLGIIGSEQTIDWSGVHPILKAQVHAEGVELSFDKGKSHGAKIFSKRASETSFTFLTSIMKSSYIDNRPKLDLDKSEKREYYVVYIYYDIAQLFLPIQLVHLLW